MKLEVKTNPYQIASDLIDKNKDKIIDFLLYINSNFDTYSYGLKFINICLYITKDGMVNINVDNSYIDSLEVDYSYYDSEIFSHPFSGYGKLTKNKNILEFYEELKTDLLENSYLTSDQLYDFMINN